MMLMVIPIFEGGAAKAVGGFHSRNTLKIKNRPDW